MLEKYRLRNGSMYWHKLYFAIMPKWTTKYSPPLGHYNYAFYMYHPHEYIMDLYREAKWFIQRGMRGYSDRDVWGWCNHHSEMMVGVLKYLRKYAVGSSIGLTSSAWDKKLAIMQQGFQAFMDEENDVISYKKLSHEAYRKLMFSRQRKLMLGLKYFRKYYCNLWD